MIFAVSALSFMVSAIIVLVRVDEFAAVVVHDASVRGGSIETIVARHHAPADRALPRRAATYAFGA
ncbi:hypothetical protein P3W24_04440 [Luteibacter sp. PPL201]|uniref:Uncharacterized protein n=1 Tax=Luteibacter sahnii TaxID=3021977 RepID=A0ABT6B802_9GAMM|nr:hypothetical protein [Luteibacter sp. PPL193]MDY1547884.1 hypothetical protein [Luteibacter sp. PPL193]